MKILSDALVYGNYRIKSPTPGLTAGTIKVQPDTNSLRVGNQDFPLAATGEYTSEPEGTLTVDKERLLVAYSRQWWTPNVVQVEVTQNTVGGQQTIMTVQHGNYSRILTNVARDTAILPHVPG